MPVVLPPLWLLVIISAVGPIVMNGVLPANTAIMAELETSYGSAQLVLSVFLLALLFGQILLGNAADRFGRRPVMLASLAGFSIGGALCAVAPSIESLLGTGVFCSIVYIFASSYGARCLWSGKIGQHDGLYDGSNDGCTDVWSGYRWLCHRQL